MKPQRAYDKKPQEANITKKYEKRHHKKKKKHVTKKEKRNIEKKGWGGETYTSRCTPLALSFPSFLPLPLDLHGGRAPSYSPFFSWLEIVEGRPPSLSLLAGHFIFFFSIAEWVQPSSPDQNPDRSRSPISSVQTFTHCLYGLSFFSSPIVQQLLLRPTKPATTTSFLSLDRHSFSTNQTQRQQPFSVAAAGFGYSLQQRSLHHPSRNQRLLHYHDAINSSSNQEQT